MSAFGVSEADHAPAVTAGREVDKIVLSLAVTHPAARPVVDATSSITTAAYDGTEPSGSLIVFVTVATTYATRTRILGPPAVRIVRGRPMIWAADNSPPLYLETYPIGQPSVGAVWTLYANADPAMTDSTGRPSTENV